MVDNQPHRTPEEVARLGSDILECEVMPTIRPVDEDKYVAIDVESGEYEIDEEDYTAVKRLRTRRPAAEIWLGRIGQPAAYRMRLQQ